MPFTERLRFAPSPTGDLHVGGARAALFNWLYARKTGGKFLLRIEDTDRERSTETALASILDSLRWLGLDWDGDLIRQSERDSLYRASVAQLLETGAAYRCFCSVEELEAERERAKELKLDYHYAGKCRNLDDDTVRRYLDEGRPATVRFRVPEGETSFDDLVHGTTTFRNDTIGDFIVARADGSPVYILGVAVDDADMGISLVMRGDDHLSNTPKQIMIMRAMGKDIPRFAHLPQVLGEDKKKLSKRHGAASVMEYRRMGFLSEAVVNFLALLGWNPGDDREKMGIGELIAAFDVEQISKKSGVFDMQKLEWLNGQYLHELSHEAILDRVAPMFVEAGLVGADELAAKREYLTEIIRLLRERCRLLPEFIERSVYFFSAPVSYDEKGEKKHFDTSAAKLLDTLADRFEALGEFTVESAEETVRILSEDLGAGAGKLIHPTRLAVTGATFGPGLFDILVLIGCRESMSRMRKAASYIRGKAE